MPLDTDRPPSGTLSGEDCLTFESDSLRLKPEGGRWPMTDGRSRMRMFPSGEEARQATAVIKKYGFNRTCYIGRRDPSMTYFRK